MASLENTQHEAFAQARFAGKSVTEAHYAAGYAGDKASASRLNRTHEVQERIAELFREAAAQTAYDKTNALRDLLAIIHTPPSDATEDHPLCEIRMGKDGPYHRLPPKLQAMSRLIKLMGWDHPPKIEVERKDNFRDLLARIRRRQPDSCSSSSSSSSSEAHEEPELVDGTTDPECAEGIANPELAEGPSTLNFQPSTALPPRQEQYALARVKGLGVMAAYHAAGYAGNTPNLAWRLNAMPEVQARIAQLNGGVAAALGYHKDDCVRDLLLIVRSKPSEASLDHPLCETRQTSWGSYHRFPSKLGALTLLARILRWNAPPEPELPHDPDLGFKKLREFVSRRS